MHPSVHAKTHPDRAAYIMSATGETVTKAADKQVKFSIAKALKDSVNA